MRRPARATTAGAAAPGGVRFGEKKRLGTVSDGEGPLDWIARPVTRRPVAGTLSRLTSA